MTFSVVARDDEAGLLGVAVASCVLAVGARVPLVRPGVGAVAVQAGGWLHWRHLLLDLLDRGLTAAQALGAIQGLDGADEAQIGLVGATGPAAAVTGPRCDRPAGHESSGAFSVQANTMAAERAWPTMREAFEDSVGSGAGLPAALLAALAAAERHGGDLRGRQSAALLVVPLQRGHVPRGDAQDPTVDLRVDDARDPVGALERLLRVHDAHRMLMRASEDSVAEQRLEMLRRAAAQAPDDPLCLPAAGIAVALSGDLDEGLALLRAGSAVNPHAPRWARWSAERAADANPAARQLAEALASADATAWDVVHNAAANAPDEQQ